MRFCTYFFISFFVSHAHYIPDVSFGERLLLAFGFLQKVMGGTITDEYGKFRLQNISPGEYVWRLVRWIRCVLKMIRIGCRNLFLRCHFQHIKSLDSVTCAIRRKNEFRIYAASRRGRNFIYAGKKTEVVVEGC